MENDESYLTYFIRNDWQQEVEGLCEQRQVYSV